MRLAIEMFLSQTERVDKGLGNLEFWHLGQSGIDEDIAMDPISQPIAKP